MTATITVVAAEPAAAPAAPGGPAASTPTTPAVAASHAGATHAGTPPDTALPARGQPSAWLAPLLIGLGLVTFAIGLIPNRRAVPLPVSHSSGWRR
jgi:hypothetical protein